MISFLVRFFSSFTAIIHSFSFISGREIARTANWTHFSVFAVFSLLVSVLVPGLALVLEEPIVADLIAAYRPGSLLADTPIELLTLHSINNRVEGAALIPGLSLVDVASGHTDDNPLIIKTSEGEIEKCLPFLIKF